MRSGIRNGSPSLPRRPPPVSSPARVGSATDWAKRNRMAWSVGRSAVSRERPSKRNDPRWMVGAEAANSGWRGNWLSEAKRMFVRRRVFGRKAAGAPGGRSATSATSAEMFCSKPGRRKPSMEKVARSQSGVKAAMPAPLAANAEAGPSGEHSRSRWTGDRASCVRASHGERGRVASKLPYLSRSRRVQVPSTRRIAALRDAGIEVPG